METVNPTIHEEYYFDCPYCGIQISDDDNTSSKETQQGNHLKCPDCGRVMIIGVAR